MNDFTSLAQKDELQVISDITRMINIQPKAVTMSSFDFTELQMDVFIRIIGHLQSMMSTSAEIVNRSFRDIVRVELNGRDFPELDRHRERFLGSVEQLVKIMVVFRWNGETFAGSETARKMFFGREDPAGHNDEIIMKQVLITGAVYGKTRGSVVLTLNPYAVPFLLYIGKGVGGTSFLPDVALSLSGVFTKRLYLCIMDWYNRGHGKDFCIGIDELKYIFCLSEELENKVLRRNYLESARRQILASSSEITFDYRLEYKAGLPVFVPPVKSRRKKQQESIVESRTKKSANCVVFSFFGPGGAPLPRRKEISGIKSTGSNRRDVLLLYFCDVCEGKNRIEEYRSRIESLPEEKVSLLISKYEFYRQGMTDGEISRKQFQDTFKKIVLREAGVDLRTRSHATNARRKTVS